MKASMWMCLFGTLFYVGVVKTTKSYCLLKFGVRGAEKPSTEEEKLGAQKYGGQKEKSEGESDDSWCKIEMWTYAVTKDDQAKFFEDLELESFEFANIYQHNAISDDYSNFSPIMNSSPKTNYDSVIKQKDTKYPFFELFATKSADIVKDEDFEYNDGPVVYRKRLLVIIPSEDTDCNNVFKNDGTSNINIEAHCSKIYVRISKRRIIV